MLSPRADLAFNKDVNIAYTVPYRKGPQNRTLATLQRLGSRDALDGSGFKIFLINPGGGMFSSQGRYAAEAGGKLLRRSKHCGQ